jgi:hypothetical protein
LHVVVFWNGLRTESVRGAGRNGQATTISSATTTTIAPSPVEHNDRVISWITVANRGGSANIVSLKLDTGGVDAYLTAPITLDDGDTLQVKGDGEYRVIISTGAEKGYGSLLLNELGVPDGPVYFGGQQALDFVLENRTSDPGSPVEGQIWLRTDL